MADRLRSVRRPRRPLPASLDRRRHAREPRPEPALHRKRAGAHGVAEQGSHRRRQRIDRWNARAAEGPRRAARGRESDPSRREPRLSRGGQRGPRGRERTVPRSSQQRHRRPAGRVHRPAPPPPSRPGARSRRAGDQRHRERGPDSRRLRGSRGPSRLGVFLDAGARRRDRRDFLAGVLLRRDAARGLRADRSARRALRHRDVRGRRLLPPRPGRGARVSLRPGRLRPPLADGLVPAPRPRRIPAPLRGEPEEVRGEVGAGDGTDGPDGPEP